MQEIKIGDTICVRAKVVEINETEKGKKFRVEVDNKYAYCNRVDVEPQNIVE